MLILALRTDKPEAELYLYEDDTLLDSQVWLAHRQLAETLHRKIINLLSQNSRSYADLGGIVIFEGPGSFTGLRIGMSVANAFSYSYVIPISASGTDNWQADGVAKLGSGHSYAVPNYGAAATTTLQA